MARLIDADALVNEWEYGFYKRLVEVLVDDAPTIDAVPVVRCKDCVYLEEQITNTLGFCSVHEDCSDADDFCSYGRRKEAET